MPSSTYGVQQLAAEIAGADQYINQQANLGLPGLDIPDMQASMARSLLAQIHQTHGLTFTTSNAVITAIGGSVFDAAQKTALVQAVGDRINALNAHQQHDGSTQTLRNPEHFLPQSLLDVLDGTSAVEVKIDRAVAFYWDVLHVYNPSELCQRALIAIIVCAHWPDAQPSAPLRRDVVDKVKRCFEHRRSGGQRAVAHTHLREYPPSPDMLPDSIRGCYTDPPVSRIPPRYSNEKHTAPMRGNNKQLRQPAAAAGTQIVPAIAGGQLQTQQLVAAVMSAVRAAQNEGTDPDGLAGLQVFPNRRRRGVAPPAAPPLLHEDAADAAASAGADAACGGPPIEPSFEPAHANHVGPAQAVPALGAHGGNWVRPPGLLALAAPPPSATLPRAPSSAHLAAGASHDPTAAHTGKHDDATAPPASTTSVADYAKAVGSALGGRAASASAKRGKSAAKVPVVKKPAAHGVVVKAEMKPGGAKPATSSAAAIAASVASPTAKPKQPASGTNAFYRGCKLQKSDAKQGWRLFIPATNVVDVLVKFDGNAGKAFATALKKIEDKYPVKKK
jgi:hypothetical protein